MPYRIKITFDADATPDTLQAYAHWIWKLPANEYINNDGLIASAVVFRSIRAGNALEFESYEVPTDPPRGLLLTCTKFKTETELYWEKRTADETYLRKLIDSGAAGDAADAIAACQMYRDNPHLLMAVPIG